MSALTEKEPIEILMMVGYGRMCALFNLLHFERPPIVRSTVSRIVAKFNQTGNVRDVSRCGRPQINHNTKLNLLLSVEDNLHVTTIEMALQENVIQTFVVKFLEKKRNCIHIKSNSSMNHQNIILTDDWNFVKAS